MFPKTLFPKPDGAHTHAYMQDPTSTRIGLPKDRIDSDQKLPFPLPGKLDNSNPLKLIEQCKDSEKCPARDFGDLDPNYMNLAEHCPTTKDNGCPLFLSAFTENTNKDLGWKEIFEFSDSSVLDVIIANFHKLKNKLNPPIKLGHDEKQALVQNSGFPSAGWITDVKRKAATNKLLAYFSNVPETITRLIESGAYKRISAELYNNYIDPETNKAFGPTIRAVSILGADVPRIKTLEDLTVIYHSDKLPYKILSEKKSMKKIKGIKKLQETIEALKADVEEVLQLPDVPEDSPVVINLKKRIKELETELDVLKAEIKAKVADVTPDVVPDVTPGDVQLSEKVKNQTDIINKLSESVKTIGSELKDANAHILEDKKRNFRSVNSKVFTPAFVDKAMDMLNFSEDDSKMFELITHIRTLHEAGTLFLSEDIELDEEIVDPTIIKLSQDKLHNEVTALAEKDKISYTDAFDRVMLLKKA